VHCMLEWASRSLMHRFLGLLGAVVGVLVPFPPSSAAQKDALAIVSVVPAGPVTRGVEVDFVFEVDLTLASSDEALLHLGFNTDEPNRWKMVTQRIVNRGHQRVSLEARVVPVDWRERGTFSAFINVGPNGSGRYTPTASVSYPITVAP